MKAVDILLAKSLGGFGDKAIIIKKSFKLIVHMFSGRHMASLFVEMILQLIMNYNTVFIH